MNARFFPALIAVATVLLAGCLPESKNPLSTPANSTIDRRLEGLYVQRRDKSSDNLGGWHFHYRGAKAGTDGRSHTNTVAGGARRRA